MLYEYRLLSVRPPVGPPSVMNVLGPMDAVLRILSEISVARRHVLYSPSLEDGTAAVDGDEEDQSDSTYENNPSGE